MSICKACDAGIWWAKDLITNAPRPLDPTPHADDKGKIAAAKISGHWVCYSISVDRPLREPFLTYTGHHATCPNWNKPTPADPATQTAPLF